MATLTLAPRPWPGLYGALAHGGDLDAVHVLAPATIAAAIVEQSKGQDLVIQQVETRFGLGFMLTNTFVPLGPNPRAFGHSGAGGSLGFADLDAGIGFGYVMNQMQNNLSGDPRVAGLIEAVTRRSERRRSLPFGAAVGAWHSPSGPGDRGRHGWSRGSGLPWWL